METEDELTILKEFCLRFILLALFAAIVFGFETLFIGRVSNFSGYVMYAITFLACIRIKPFLIKLLSKITKEDVQWQ